MADGGLKITFTLASLRSSSRCTGLKYPKPQTTCGDIRCEAAEGHHNRDGDFLM